MDTILPFCKAALKGKILPFLDKVTGQKCKGVTRKQNCPFVKEGQGVHTSLFSRRSKGAILPLHFSKIVTKGKCPLSNP